MTHSWWLVAAGSARRRIDAGGITIGRAARSDIVVASERASRVQALVVLGPRGPQLLSLGRATTRVNGVAVEREIALAHGDAIDLPGLKLEVARTSESSGERSAAWVLERANGTFYGIARSPFRIGGGEDDELRLEGWSPHAIALHIAGVTIEVEASASSVDGRALGEGERRVLKRGSVIERADERFTLLFGGAMGEGSTLLGSRSLDSTRSEIELEFLPRGGRLFVREGGLERSIYLADKRCDLVALLLSPPEPVSVGEFVDDAVLLTRIWGKELKARTDVNVLVHRTRKDLELAGVDGARIERVKGGGATRFRIDDGTKVILG